MKTTQRQIFYTIAKDKVMFYCIDIFAKPDRGSPKKYKDLSFCIGRSDVGYSGPNGQMYLGCFLQQDYISDSDGTLYFSLHVERLGILDDKIIEHELVTLCQEADLLIDIGKNTAMATYSISSKNFMLAQLLSTAYNAMEG